jgi:hypothetical protein
MVSPKTIISWVLSPIGKILGFAGMVLIAILTVFAKGRQAGRDAEKRRIETIQRKAGEEVKKIEEKVKNRTPSEQRKRLGPWAEG